MFNRKFLTKLLDEDFRRRTLAKNRKFISDESLKIKEYAMYVVDYQIIHRSQEFQNDKTAFYGFSPLAVFGYVANDGAVKTMMVEMNSVNHFLKMQNGNAAVDVALCIISQVYAENKDKIRDFDPQTISTELKKLDAEYKNSIDNEDNKQKETDKNGNRRTQDQIAVGRRLLAKGERACHRH